MASGIAMNKGCKTAYTALSKRDHSAIILKIAKDNTEISLDSTVPPFGDDLEKEWKARILDSLPENDCRYIVTDFSWRDSPTVTSSKIILILWSPDLAPIKNKMIYAASLEAVTADMPVQKTLQTTELDEIAYSAVKKNVGK